MPTRLHEDLRRIRVESGVSVAELARRAETSRAAIHAYETGARDPSVSTAERILACLGHKIEVVPQKLT